MSRQRMKIANGVSIATELRTRIYDSASKEDHFQHVIPTLIGEVPLPLAAYLERNDSVEMAADGSSADLNYDLAPGEDEVYRIYSLTAFLICDEDPPIPTRFGSLSALSDGLLLKVIDSDAATIFDIAGGQPIKNNADFATIGYIDFSIVTLEATNHARVKIDFATPLRLDGADGEILRAVVRDDLTGLTRFRIFASGISEGVLT